VKGFKMMHFGTRHHQSKGVKQSVFELKRTYVKATGGLTEALFSSRFALTSRIDIFLQSYVCICIQPVWDTISEHRSVSSVSCAKMERGSAMVIQVNSHTAHYSLPLLPTYS